MRRYRWCFLLLATLVVSCKPTKTVVDGGTGKSMGGDGDNNTTVVKKLDVDTDLSKFRITYDDAANTYETFGDPKSIKQVEDNTTTPDKTSPITSTDHINETLENKLGQIRYLNGDIDKISGYRILIYSGNNINKAQSLQTDLRIALSGTGFSTKLDYKPPNYTLKAGRFFSKLKAHELYSKLKEEFPSAVLITEDIRFNPSNYIIGN